MAQFSELFVRQNTFVCIQTKQCQVLISFLNASELYHIFTGVNALSASPSYRAVSGVGLGQLACWDCGFESHREHGCLSVVSFVCYQLEVSATS